MMKIIDKTGSLGGKPIESSGQEVKDRAKIVGREDAPSARVDRVTLSGGGEISQTASEVVGERRKKIDEIQTLLRAGGAKAYFQARPNALIGSAQGISSEVALMQEIMGKR